MYEYSTVQRAQISEPFTTQAGSVTIIWPDSHSNTTCESNPQCYLRALDFCFDRVAAKHEAKTGEKFDVRDYEHSLFHMPYQKLVQKSFARYYWNQHRINNNVDGNLDQYLSEPVKDTYTNRDLEKACLALSQEDYNAKVCMPTYSNTLYALLTTQMRSAGLPIDPNWP